MHGDSVGHHSLEVSIDAVLERVFFQVSLQHISQEISVVVGGWDHGELYTSASGMSGICGRGAIVVVRWEIVVVTRKLIVGGGEFIIVRGKVFIAVFMLLEIGHMLRIVLYLRCLVLFQLVLDLWI